MTDVTQELYISNLNKWIDKQHADIERLRDDYGILKRDYDALRADNEQLRETRENEGNEIERLTGLIAHYRKWLAEALEPKP